MGLNVFLDVSPQYVDMIAKLLRFDSGLLKDLYLIMIENVEILIDWIYLILKVK